MPWCPKCKTEYREGFDTCSDCNEKLVEQLETKPVERSSTCGSEYEFGREAFLTNVKDDIEADLIESLMKSYNIPILRKHKSSGAYMSIYMGKSLLGIDLFVPESLSGKAQEILENKIDSSMTGGIPEDRSLPGAGNIPAFNPEKYMKNRRKIAQWILFIFFLPGVIIMLINFFQEIARIFKR